MSKGEKILQLIKNLEKLDNEQLEQVNKSAEACLIVQTLKSSKSLGAIIKNS
ncbi:hypothetical protein [Romboutsia lituseburensis]|uniref:hypothetical protein n=1 Tax=Romboutsia lituseburensis TaxID=1537 RepID=UPI0022EB75C9|nr:hypothetical protein [Romboutsia lituseburensis]